MRLHCGKWSAARRIIESSASGEFRTQSWVQWFPMPIGEPITHCPICRYDLPGLPPNHRCPECGFEYDESMRIWRPGRTLRQFPAIPLLVMGLVFTLVPALALIIWLPTTMSWGWVLFLVAINPVCYALTTIVHFEKRNHSFVIVCPHALMYNRPFGRNSIVPWANIKLNKRADSVLQLRGGVWIPLMTPFSILDPKDCKEVLAAISEYAKPNADQYTG